MAKHYIGNLSFSQPDKQFIILLQLYRKSRGKEKKLSITLYLLCSSLDEDGKLTSTDRD